MKKAKRRWAWTAKNLRKSKSVRKAACYGNPPKSFRDAYNRGDREQTKAGIIQELNGNDGVFPRRTHRNTAKWDYW